MPKKTKTSAKRPALSLAQFAHNRKVAERQATCAICRLPEEIRAEIKLARSRKVERATVTAWLASIGHKIDDLDFQTHAAGLHEQRETRSA